MESKRDFEATEEADSLLNRVCIIAPRKVSVTKFD